MLPFLEKDVQYDSVAQEDTESLDMDVEDKPGERPPRDSRSRKSKFGARIQPLLSVSWILVAVLGLLNLYQWQTRDPINFHQDVYSPAVSAVKYKNLASTAGLEKDVSPYQGPPSDLNNQLWSDLYNFGMSRLSTSEARQLVNRTVPVPSEPGNYVVTLDVFHQLHCLNMIRARVWQNGSIPEFGNQGVMHMDHCIDSIRESLMCAGDITPRPFGWNVKQSSVLPVNRVLRTCRDFDAIKSWALDRQVKGFDFSVHVVDDPLGDVEIEY